MVLLVGSPFFNITVDATLIVVAVNAEAFVTAVQCESTTGFPESQLLSYLNDEGTTVEASC